MKKNTVVTIIALILAAGLSAACSSGTAPKNADQTAKPKVEETPPKAEDAPANVKAAFPDAQSFTKTHKDIPNDVIAGIEKDTGAKVPDTDHHSYLAFSTVDGVRKQIGAATIVKVDGKEIVVVYDSKEGSPVIREIRAEGVPAGFVKQFAGKGHDNDLLLGMDIKSGEMDQAKAKAFTEAVRVDVLTMQALFGAAHSH